MNVVELVRSLRQDDSNLMGILGQVRKILNNATKDIALAGKTLRAANTEQPALLAYYDEIRVHMQILSEYYKIRILEQRAKVLRMIAEQSPIAYTGTMMEKLSEEDPTLIKFAYNKLEADEALAHARSIVDAFEQRGYSLKNITESVVAQAQDEQLILN
jgi:hypothetical protein